MSTLTCQVYLVGGKDLEHCLDVFEHDVAAIVATTTATRRPPAVRIAGCSSSWLVLAGGQLHRDALFAVTTGADGEAALAGSRLDGRLLAALDEPLDQVLELLSTITSGALALVAVATSAAARPASSEAEIARCRRWLERPLLQYLTGRGAQRRIAGPWTRFLDNHEYMLRRVERAWVDEVRPRLAALPAGHPLRPMLAALALASTERETLDILEEYQDRLIALSTECARVSAEIGVVGTLASLALVPVAEVLGWWFLAPVAVATLLYFHGYALASIPQRLARLRAERRRRAIRPDPAHPTIAEVVGRLADRNVRILVGPRVAVADVAASFSMWLALLQHSSASDVLGAVELACQDSPDERNRIVLGGPLVRPRVDPSRPDAGSMPICDLTDVGGRGWHVRAGDAVLAWASQREHLGCVSTVEGSPDVLFVYGTRDSGTVAASRWLTSLLRAPAPRQLQHQARSPWHLQDGAVRTRRPRPPRHP